MNLVIADQPRSWTRREVADHVGGLSDEAARLYLQRCLTHLAEIAWQLNEALLDGDGSNVAFDAVEGAQQIALLCLKMYAPAQLLLEEEGTDGKEKT